MNSIDINNLDKSFEIIVWGLSTAIALLFVIWIFLKITHFFVKKMYRRDQDNAIYLVRLPKEKPEESGKNLNIQEVQEDISIGELLFASIGGLRAQKGIKSWFLGRNDNFSFEVVANKKTISFYMSAPRESARYFEQQLQAHYPSAVMETVTDYNIFNAHSSILAGNLKTKRHFIFPLKTYKNIEGDPMNSILNVMSKLNPNDAIALQIIARSAKSSWHKKAVKVVRKAIKENSIHEGLRLVQTHPFFRFIGDIIKTAKPKSEQDKQNQYSQMNAKRLTSMEEEMLKSIEEKNSKAGLDVNIRIVVSADDDGTAHILFDNMISAFNQYNYYEQGNNFTNKISTSHTNRVVKDFIYRRLEDNDSFILNTEELNSIYHLPLSTAETPNIQWLTAKHAAAPTNIPESGVLLGKNLYRGVAREIYAKAEDRRRHTYIVGKSGVGKSVLLSNLAIQDIENGAGICLLDPHGDLVADVLERIPPERAEDVILFAPADIERPLAMNLLEFDPKYPEQKTFVINEMIKVFDKLYDLKSTGGPIFEQYMRNALLLIMSDPESGSTLMEVPKVLADPEFRNMKLERCPDHTVVDFWRKEAEKAGGDAALANVVPYITSKLTQFISNDTMRPIIGQQKSSFNLRDVMDGSKILLIDLSKGQIGEMNSSLLGLIIVGKILMAALSRASIPAEDRKDFYLYIDEFQNFTTDSVCDILSEARKYGLSLTMAHQYLGQLVENGNDTTIKDAVFGNVGTWITFKVGSEDAEELEKEFGPTFNQFDMINIEKGTAYVKLLVDNTTTRPFSMQTTYPILGTKRDGIAEKIKSLSRYKYGRERSLIEAEIRKRTST